MFSKINLRRGTLILLVLITGGAPIQSRDLLFNPANQKSGAILLSDHNRPHKNKLLIGRLLDDARYLTGRSDFYMIVGSIGLAPKVVPAPFNHESPELTEHWGASLAADNFFESGEIVGSGLFPVAVSAASWGVGRVAGIGKLRDFGSDLLRAQAVNGLLTGAIKVAVNRRRPNGGAYSYPSGHTSCAFATAGTIYRNFGKTWGIPAMLLAGYVGLSRLQEGKHYLSDVIAGGLLGSYVSLNLVGNNSRSRKDIALSPLIIDGGAGFSISSRF